MKYDLPENWSFEPLDAEKTVTLPPGTYYVGDLCYALDNNLCDSVFLRNGFGDGLYTEATSGRSFFVASTYAGDGGYTDEYGRLYGVDAGILSICSSEFFDKREKVPDMNNARVNHSKGVSYTYYSGGYAMTFPKGVTCRFTGRSYEDDDIRNGQFYFSWDEGSFHINTAEFGGEEDEENEL